MSHLDPMEEKYNGPLYHQSWSSAGPSSSTGPSFTTQVNILPSRARKRKVLNTDTISESLRSFVEPEITEEERLELDRQEKERLRFKEIGRLVCELDLTDFAPDKLKNDRKTFMIASRGEEILASVHRNLTVIQSKLGEYAVGTIFEDVDKLTKSFANVSPNALSRLNQVVAEKLRLRAEASAALMELSNFGQAELNLKAEEPQEPMVKLEEPDDYHYWFICSAIFPICYFVWVITFPKNHFVQSNLSQRNTVNTQFNKDKNIEHVRIKNKWYVKCNCHVRFERIWLVRGNYKNGRRSRSSSSLWYTYQW